MRQTLIETQIFRISPQAITEAVKTENGNLIVEGRLQSAETKNGNGRYYPRNVLEREINKYKSGPISENRALGELDHPDSSIINLKNVSHNIKDVWWDGNDVIGKIEILPTPSGNILTQLFKNGITVVAKFPLMEYDSDYDLPATFNFYDVIGEVEIQTTDEYDKDAFNRCLKMPNINLNDYIK
jgi:hypothetical protein